ncbi:MAG: hypothetical protein V4723_05685 [Pseudomonadota bacterium]
MKLFTRKSLPIFSSTSGNALRSVEKKRAILTSGLLVGPRTTCAAHTPSPLIAMLSQPLSFLGLEKNFMPNIYMNRKT